MKKKKIQIEDTKNKSTKIKNKKSYIILILTILLSAIVVYNAYSKYKTTLTGNSASTVAKWSFKVNGQTYENFSIDLATTREGISQEADVQEGFIGPGTAGAFEIEIDARGTEVSLEYNINMDVDYENNEKFPKNLIFYSDAEMKNAIYHTENFINIKDIIAHNDDNKVKKQTIYWKWDYETGQTQQEVKNNDIADSLWMGKNISLSINVIGKQINEELASNQYAVTFNANGGTLQGYGNATQATKLVNYGEEYGELPIPTREGYTFAGWNGKNMLNLDLYNVDKDFVKISDGKITILKTDNATSYSTKSLDCLVNGKTYCISADKEGDFTGRIYGFFGTSLWNNNKKITFKYSSSDDKGRFLVYQNTTSNPSINMILISDSVVFSNIQLEEGNTPTEYEPYFVKNSTKVTQSKNHNLTAIWVKKTE